MKDVEHRRQSVAIHSALALPAEFLRPGITPRQLIVILWAYRLWIVAIATTVVVLTGVVSKLLPKTYESTATLLIDYQVNDPVMRQEFPTALAASYMATQFEFLQSPTVLLPVVDRLGWADDPARTAGYRGTSGLREYLVNEMRKRLRFSMGRESRFASITALARDPAEAARVANTIAEVYAQLQRERTNAPTRERTERYTTQFEELRIRFEEAQAALAAFRQANGLVDLDRSVDLETERLRDLQQRLAQAESDERSAQQRARQLGQGADFAVLDSALIQSLKTQLAVLEARQAEVATQLGRNHPERRALEEEIRLARDRLAREQRQYDGAIASQSRSASGSAAALARAVSDQQSRVLATRKLADEGQRYQREVDAARSLYQSVLQGYDQVLLGASANYSNVSIVSPATPPLKATKPVVRTNVALAVFVGGFLGVATALLRELLNRRIRCREDVERDLGIPVLAELQARPNASAASRWRQLPGLGRL